MNTLNHQFDRPNGYKLALGCAISVTLALVGCGTKSSKGAKKVSAAADVGAIPVITAYGDNCDTSGVATSIVGVNARVGLNIANFNPNVHTVGYVGDAPNLNLNPGEATMQSPPEGTFGVTVVVRNVADCESQNVDGVLVENCRPNGMAVRQTLGSDITKKINFVISKDVQNFIQSGTIGQGQSGIISDVVNGKGLIGFLSKTGLLSGLGGAMGGGAGGGLGSITDLIGSANKANDALEAAKLKGQTPVGGCPQNPAFNGSGTTTPSGTSTSTSGF